MQSLPKHHAIDINLHTATSFGGNSSRHDSVPPAAGTPLPQWNSGNSDVSSSVITTPAPAQSVSFTSPRCREKGCVFPASPTGNGNCTYHERQQAEPGLFHSNQPSNLLLDRAKFGPAEAEQDIARRRERRRMAILWEQFQSEECG